jgi:hypothetical protein
MFATFHCVGQPRKITEARCRTKLGDFDRFDASFREKLIKSGDVMGGASAHTRGDAVATAISGAWSLDYPDSA